MVLPASRLWDAAQFPVERLTVKMNNDVSAKNVRVWKSSQFNTSAEIGEKKNLSQKNCSLQTFKTGVAWNNKSLSCQIGAAVSHTRWNSNHRRRRRTRAIKGAICRCWRPFPRLPNSNTLTRYVCQEFFCVLCAFLNQNTFLFIFVSQLVFFIQC